MRILFINTIDNVGGAALVAWNLGQQLEKDDHEIKYIVGFKKSNSYMVYQLKKNALLDYLTSATPFDINFIYRGLITKFISNDIDFGAKQEIINHPWYRKSDIIHCNNLHGNYIQLSTLAEMSKKKKIIWTLHDEWAIMAHGSCIIEERIKDGFFRRSNLNLYPAMLWNNEEYLAKKKARIYQQSDLNIVVPSVWLKDKVERSILGNNKVELIHNGIDTNIFKKHHKTISRKKLGLPLDKKIILFVANSGKNNPLKGWSYTEKVISYYKDRNDLFFLCVGGNEKDTKKTALNVKYVPYINDNHMLAQYYSSSDMLLFASLVESFGLVAIEAMACGVPVVGFPVGIIPETVIHKETGYIAKHQDSRDLIRGIDFMLDLPKKDKDRISDQLVQVINKDYSLEVMTDNYVKLYDMVLKKDSTRTGSSRPVADS